MDLGIKGKRAVVTGGTSGLGLASAEALAREGADLVLFARSRQRLDEVGQDLQARFGVAVEGVAGDITRKQDVQALAAAVAARGGADILVPNVPRPPQPMREFLAEDDDDKWQRAYQDQLHGGLLVLRLLTPLLLGKGWGRVVAITSASVKQPMARHAMSTIFRAGLHAALKHLANEVASQGVTVNAVAPATIVTPTFGQHHNLEARVQAVPLKRPGTTEELGAVVAFLASRQAGFITGQVVQLDGGQTLSLL
ncbi:SDR family oxidoreductase [Pseudorhodoferax sp.]|uniref:SDR family oxidoreductase n=1 Tax=Pseudorhodoferax sp. TaxID=1993553 RepID=UPI0039E53717